MSHPADARLAALGIDLSGLADDVLDALRAAVPVPSDPLERAYAEAVLEPPDAAERARQQEAFGRDVAAYLGSGTDLDAPTDLETGHDR